LIVQASGRLTANHFLLCDVVPAVQVQRRRVLFGRGAAYCWLDVAVRPVWRPWRRYPAIVNGVVDLFQLTASEAACVACEGVGPPTPMARLFCALRVTALVC
jgi:hypothetical protein